MKESLEQVQKGKPCPSYSAWLPHSPGLAAHHAQMQADLGLSPLFPSTFHMPRSEAPLTAPHWFLTALPPEGLGITGH